MQFYSEVSSYAIDAVPWRSTVSKFRFEVSSYAVDAVPWRSAVSKFRFEVRCAPLTPFRGAVLFRSSVSKSGVRR
jgi:hypothetical protein